MNDKYITVSDLNLMVRNKLENDYDLRTVYLKGEISNFTDHTSSGHLYFDLKDNGARIAATMWKYNKEANLKFTPSNGMNVLVIGSVTLFERDGKYQINVKEMIEDGVGNLYLEFEKLKKKLAEKGYFREELKKPIPKFPKRIAVITADTGAAIKDILTTINRRYNLCEVILFPSLVQGENAKDDIVKNIRLADSMDFDTIIVGRGGGSIEDLWAFNEEIVAEAIYNAKTPIISAVGHEPDFTIADFVADLRAPTPTAAGELAVPNKEEVKEFILNRQKQIIKNMINILKLKKHSLDVLTNHYIFKKPETMYEIKMQQVDTLVDKLITRTNMVLDYKTNKFSSLIDKLETLSPIKTLKRGYSITKKGEDIITDISSLKKGDIIDTTLGDGLIKSEIMEVNNG